MKNILRLTIIISLLFVSCGQEKFESKNNVAEYISTDTAKLGQYMDISKFKPTKTKFKYTFINNSSDGQRLTVPGPSDSRLEVILYFDSLTFDKLVLEYKKSKWHIPDVQKNNFNFEWLEKETRDELDQTVLESSCRPDLFFTKSQRGHCWLLNKKVLCVQATY